MTTIIIVEEVFLEKTHFQNNRRFKNIIEAHYILVDYEKKSGNNEKLDYALKINDSLIRHMISVKREAKVEA